jgi:hypothetical protein
VPLLAARLVVSEILVVVAVRRSRPPEGFPELRIVDDVAVLALLNTADVGVLALLSPVEIFVDGGESGFPMIPLDDMLEMLVSVGAQKTAALVANTLEDLVDDILVADVEKRIREDNVAEVAGAVAAILLARRADVLATHGPKTRVKQTLRNTLTPIHQLVTRHFAR